MTEIEIKQQVIENLETLLEKARQGESLRLVASLKSDDDGLEIAVGAVHEIATLLLGWVKGNRDLLAAMELAAEAARRMLEAGRFDDTAQ